MFAILKKEFKSYFLSPIGYVVMGIFLLVFSVFFALTTISWGSVDLGSLYYYTGLYGLIVIVPMLTTRMFAEERKNGTEQLILTSKVSITGVVIAKLLAALAVIGITVLISFIYYFIMLYFGNPNIKSVLVYMFGFILLSMAALSMGMFASSITENQVIAGVITIALLIVPTFLQNINSVFGTLTIMNYYDKFPSGVISLSEIISLLSFSLLFIVLTIIIMQRRKQVK